MSLFATSPDARAFAMNLRIRGENVTLGGVSIRALINRLPERQQPKGMEDVSTLDGSVIQIAASYDEPERGDVFTDSKGFSHNIRKVKNLFHCWNCECEVTR